MDGIEKNIDKLGRVVIPIEYRKALGIEIDSCVTISRHGQEIIISAAQTSCALCGEKTELSPKYRLCKKCVLDIKNNA